MEDVISYAGKVAAGYKLGKTLGQLGNTAARAVGYKVDPEVNKPYNVRSLKRSRKNHQGFARNLALRAKGIGKDFGEQVENLTSNTGNITWENDECSYTYFGELRRADLASLMDIGMLRLEQEHGGALGGKYVVQDASYDATKRANTMAEMAILPKSKAVIEFKNNNLVNVRLDFYEWVCVDDTSLDIATLMNSGITQATNGAYSGMSTNALVYPTKVRKYVEERWHLVKQGSVTLKPGETTFYKMHFQCKKTYDSRFYELNANGMTYCHGLSRFLQVRACGTLGHDTTDKTKVGLLKGSVDWREVQSIYLKIGQGIERHQFKITALKDTITVGQQVQSEEPAEMNPQ